jgi:hypothetical protein
LAVEYTGGGNPSGVRHRSRCSLRGIEVCGDLHQMGKLGRLVTAKEAAALV